MRNLVFPFALAGLANLAFVDEPELPRVEKSSTTMRSGRSVGQRLKDIIPPHSVTRIAITRMVSSVASDLDPDGVIRALFASDGASVEWGLLASESVRVEYAVVTNEALFILSICGEFRETKMTAAILRGNGFACRFNLIPEADHLAERIVVDSSDRSAFVLGSHPDGDRNFQRRIAELRGRRMQDIVDLDKIRKIVRPQPYNSKIGEKAVDLSDDLMVSALLTGRIVDRRDMHFQLQWCREFVLQMPKGRITTGVYYRPVGYIRFGDDESYWFLFGDARVAPQHADEER